MDSMDPSAAADTTAVTTSSVSNNNTTATSAASVDNSQSHPSQQQQHPNANDKAIHYPPTDDCHKDCTVKSKSPTEQTVVTRMMDDKTTSNRPTKPNTAQISRVDNTYKEEPFRNDDDDDDVLDEYGSLEEEQEMNDGDDDDDDYDDEVFKSESLLNDDPSNTTTTTTAMDHWNHSKKRSWEATYHSYESLLSKRLYSDAALNLLVACEQRKRILMKPGFDTAAAGAAGNTATAVSKAIKKKDTTPYSMEKDTSSDATKTTTKNNDDDDDHRIILKFPPVLPLPSKRLIGSVFYDQIIPTLLNQLQQQQHYHHHHHQFHHQQQQSVQLQQSLSFSSNTQKKQQDMRIPSKRKKTSSLSVASTITSHNHNKTIDKKKDQALDGHDQKENDDEEDKNKFIFPDSIVRPFLFSQMGINSNSSTGYEGEQQHGGGVTKICNCKRSNCLKLYCDCFAAGVYCHFTNDISTIQNENHTTTTNDVSPMTTMISTSTIQGVSGNITSHKTLTSPPPTSSSSTILRKAQVSSNTVSNTVPSCRCVSCKNVPIPICPTDRISMKSDPEKDRREAMLAILERNPKAFRPRAQVLAGYSSNTKSSSAGDVGLLLPPDMGGSGFNKSFIHSSMYLNNSTSIPSLHQPNQSQQPQSHQESQTRLYEWPQALGASPRTINPSLPTKGLSGCNCKKTSCLKKYCECFQAFMFCNLQICRCTNCMNIEGHPGREEKLLRKQKMPISTSSYTQPQKISKPLLPPPPPPPNPMIPFMTHVSRLPLPPLTATKLEEIKAIELKRTEVNRSHVDGSNDDSTTKGIVSAPGTTTNTISIINSVPEVNPFPVVNPLPKVNPVPAVNRIPVANPLPVLSSGVTLNIKKNHDNIPTTKNKRDTTIPVVDSKKDTIISYTEFPIESFPTSTDPMAVLYSVVSTAVKATSTTRSDRAMDSKMNVETDPFLPPSSFTIPLSSGVLAFGKSATSDESREISNPSRELEKKWIHAKERLEVHIHDIQHILSHERNIEKTDTTHKKAKDKEYPTSSMIDSANTASTSSSSIPNTEQVPLSPTFARAMVDGISRDMRHVCDLMEGTETRIREWLRRHQYKNTNKSPTSKIELPHETKADHEMVSTEKDITDNLQCTEETPWSSNKLGGTVLSSDVDQDVIIAAQEATLLFEIARIIRRKAFQLARERNDKT